MSIRNKMIGKNSGEYIIYFRNGVELLAICQEDKVIRVGEYVHIIIRHVFIDTEIANKIMNMSDRKIDKVEFRHGIYDADTKEEFIMNSKVDKCEMLKFGIESAGAEASKYQIVIRAWAKNVNMYCSGGK